MLYSNIIVTRQDIIVIMGIIAQLKAETVQLIVEEQCLEVQS